MDSNKNLKLGVVFSYITIAVNIIVSLTYTPFLLGTLGTQQYGLYSMGQSIVSYLGLTEFGFGNAIVRYASQYRVGKSKDKSASLYGMFLYIYRIMAIFILVVGSVICLFADRFFTISTGEEGYRQLKIIIAIMVCNMALGFVNQPYSAIITSYERFAFIKITNLCYVLLKPAVMIPLLIWGYKAIALSCVSFLLQQVLNFINVYYVRKILHVQVDYNRKHMDFSILKEIVNYSFYIFLCSIVGQLNDNTDTVILGVIYGETAVAVYSIGYQLNTYMQQMPGVVSSVFFPRVTVRITQGASMDEMTQLLIKVGRIQYYIAFLMYSGFIFWGRQFILLWVGEEYDISYWIVLALVIPAIIPNIQTMAVNIILAMNRNKFRAVIYVICTILNVIFSIPAGLKFGPLGCAICTGLTTLLTRGIIINWYFWKKIHLKIGNFWKNILQMTVKFIPLLLVATIIIMLPIKLSWIVLVSEIMLYMILFAINAWILCMNEEEKELIFNILKKLNRKSHS